MSTGHIDASSDLPKENVPFGDGWVKLGVGLRFRLVSLDKLEVQCMLRVWVRGGVYRVLLGKLEGRRPLERPRRRWVGNIRMDLQEMRCGYMDWIGLARDRNRWRTLVGAVMDIRVP